MWLLGLAFFVSIAMLFNNSGSSSNNGKHTGRNSMGGGIPYRFRKQIRHSIRK